MTHLVSLPTPVDVLGIGFGPSNIALAIALDELAAKRGTELRRLFLERQESYRWHGNTIVAQSDLQISFLKDLVSLRDPTSKFTFINYLHSQGRLSAFINLKTFFPCRLEFNDYLRWVAGHFAEDCEYGEEALALEPVMSGRTIEQLRVHSRDARGREQVRQTRSLVIGTGGTPRIPEAFSALKDEPRVFHHARYLEGMARLPPHVPLRIAIVGGGQSAAEALIDLNDSHPAIGAELILRAPVLRPSDDSPFVNEIFSPATTDWMFGLAEEERARTIEDYANTNYSVVNPELIERIYSIFYRQKITGIDRHALLCRRDVLAAVPDRDGVTLLTRDLAGGENEARRYDAVILATGYERNAHRRLLAPLAEHLGDFQVDRHYRLQTEETLRVPVFLQGYCQSSHGLSDTLLSVLPIRSEEIAGALYDTLAPAAPGRRYAEAGRPFNVGSF